MSTPDQVGVAGPGPGDAAPPQLARLGGLGGHDVLPVGPVAVGDQHRDRRAEGLAGADAGEPLDVVALDLHPGAAAVALHPAGEVAVDPLGGDRQAGGEALDDGDERLAVRFARGGEAQVHAS